MRNALLSMVVFVFFQMSAKAVDLENPVRINANPNYNFGVLNLGGVISVEGSTQNPPIPYGIAQGGDNSYLVLAAGASYGCRSEIGVRGNWDGSSFTGGYIDFKTGSLERLRITEAGQLNVTGNIVQSGSFTSNGAVTAANVTTTGNISAGFAVSAVTVSTGSLNATGNITTQSLDVLGGMTLGQTLSSFNISTANLGATNSTITNLSVPANLQVTGSTSVAGVFVNGGYKVKRTAIANSNYIISTHDYLVALTSITADRTFTLPLSSAVGAGKLYIIKDESGQISNLGKRLFIAPQGGDLMDGLPPGPRTISGPYQSLMMYTNGAGKWFLISFVGS